jgi:hypothetical protein
VDDLGLVGEERARYPSGMSYVEVVALGPASGAALVLRQRERLTLTAIAKLTLGLREGELTPERPTPVRRREQHHRASPASSIRAASELVPARPFCDLTFVGHACPGSPTARHTVRLGLLRGGVALVDKRLVVSAEAPFSRLPLVYERSYGGVGYPENPLGTGVRGSTPPSITWPGAHGEPPRPACYAPISATWPARRKLAPGVPWKALEEGYAELAAPVGPEAFSAAPPDQRPPLLEGGETLVLEGLLEGTPELRATLPRAQARGLFVPAGASPDQGVELALALDGVHVDGDARVVELTFRADLAVTTAALGPGARLAVAVEPSSSAPSKRALVDACRAPSPPSGPSAAPRPTERPGPLGGTMALDAPRADATQALPPERAPASLPFAAPRPSPHAARAGAPSSPEGALPGAPWSPALSGPDVPRASAPLTETLALESPTRGEHAEPSEPEAVLAAPDPSARAPEAQEPAPAPSDPWRRAEAAPAPAPSAPERPPPFVAPRISVGGALYGKRK